MHMYVCMHMCVIDHSASQAIRRVIHLRCKFSAKPEKNTHDMRKSRATIEWSCCVAIFYTFLPFFLPPSPLPVSTSQQVKRTSYKFQPFLLPVACFNCCLLVVVLTLFRLQSIISSFYNFLKFFFFFLLALFFLNYTCSP